MAGQTVRVRVRHEYPCGRTLDRRQVYQLRSDPTGERMMAAPTREGLARAARTPSAPWSGDRDMYETITYDCVCGGHLRAGLDKLETVVLAAAERPRKADRVVWLPTDLRAS
jgi:hypothetical protein